MDRLWLILALLSLPHCSSSSEALRLRGGESIESASEGIGQSGIVNKLSEEAVAPKAGETDPAPASYPSESNPAPSPAPGPTVLPETPSEGPAKLPSVTLESDNALKPIPILGGVGAPPADETYTPPPLFTLAKHSGDSDIDLQCEESNPLGTQIKCFLESGGTPKSVNPANVSWTVMVFNCQSVIIRGNADRTLCEESDISKCDSLRPGAWLSFDQKDIQKCLADQAQLIFTITDKTTSKSSSVTLNLKQVTPKG